MLTRCAALLAALCGVCAGGTPAGQIVTVNDVQFKLGKKVVPFEAIEFHDVTFYEANVVGTGEDCVIITGYIVNNLADHLYTVRIKVGVWDNGIGQTEGQHIAEAIVSAPPPKKRVKFIATTLVQHGLANGFNITYSLERLTAKNHLGPRTAPPER